MTETTQSDFRRWYKSVDLDNDEERVEKLWNGLSSVADGVQDDDIEGLVRITFNSRHAPQTKIIERIREKFVAADADIDPDNEREMQILASTCLAAVMGEDDYYAARTALSITTAFLGNGRVLDLPMDLLSLAENRLSSLAYSLRKRHLFKFPSPLTLNKTKIDEAAATNVIPDVAKAVSSSIQATLNTLTKENKTILQQLVHLAKVQDEELQMLWWLIGERSDSLDMNFSDVSTNAQPLVFGIELAKATGLLPGPSSIKAIMSRAGLRDNDRISIPEAVNALPPELSDSLVSEMDNISPVTCPIHYAIARQRETGENEAWIAAWEAAIDVSKGHSLGILTIGNLFYRECLLAQISESDL